METRVPYILLCASIGILCTATLLHIIGMSSPKWVKGDSEGRKHFGIFEICSEDDANYNIFICQDFEFDKITMKQQVVQVLAFMALVTGVTACGAAIVLFLIVYLSRQVSRRTVIVGIAVPAIASIASSMFIFSVMGIFLDRLYVKTHEHDWLKLDHAFYLCPIAGVLFVVGFVVTIVASKYMGTTPTEIRIKTAEESIALTTTETCALEESKATKTENCE